MLEADTIMPPRSATPTPGVRQSLRAATADAHARLDACARRVNLADRESYGRFLQAQSGPVMALEAALRDFGVARLLPDWPLRSRTAALHYDLEHLTLRPGSCPAVRLASVAPAFGTLYVLEGSRLGARVLLQQILAAAPDLRPATRFLSHGSDQRLWTTFLQVLEAKLCINDVAGCAQGAREAFALFEASFMQAFGFGNRSAAI
jgi:heme oxygenase (biliverdin-IX-beta and delta-forming)